MIFDPSVFVVSHVVVDPGRGTGVSKAIGADGAAETDTRDELIFCFLRDAFLLWRGTTAGGAEPDVRALVL